jgi:hypothetical protein
MPTATYIALGTTTLTGSDASVEFSSIPATYRDIVAVIIGTCSTATAGGRMYLNSDTGANYSTVRMYGTGSGSGTSDAFTGSLGYIGDVFTSGPTTILINLQDYSATDKHKTWLYRMNQAGSYVMAGAGRWASTNAVDNIKFELNDSRTWQSGTTISLYGIVS